MMVAAITWWRAQKLSLFGGTVTCSGILCGCAAPCWRDDGTYHNELDGDWQRELVTVAAVNFFDQDKHKEGKDANH